MNKNLKYVFLLTTIVFLLVSVSAISAENTTGKDITDKATTVTAEKTVDTQKVVNNNKNILKTEKVNKTTKAEPKTHVVNQDNVDEIFNGTEKNGLNDSINEGDTLDFQGTIDKDHSLVINKPVNVISSTKDAIISLHSVSAGLSGEDPGNSFVINKGASGSYISGLYLNNTQCWVYNLHNATLYNMTMHVENARVGSGVGQTSIRFSNNVTLDNCYIYTKDNGGSSSFVWTGSSNCTLINSVVEGAGNVGNILYVGNVMNPGALPEGYVLSSVGNNVINCTIRGGNGGISNPLQIGGNNTLIKGNKFYSNGTVGALAFGATRNNVTYIDNELYDKAALTIVTNSTASGNVIYGTGKTTIETGANAYNNTFKAVGIGTTSTGATNVKLEENTINGAITVEQKSSNSNITGNTINGKVTSKGANITISENNIRTETDEYAIEATGAQNVITNNKIYAKTERGNNAVKASATSTVDENVPKTYIVTQENVDEIFNGTDYETNAYLNATNSGLSNFIYEGDVLDFQGTIDKNRSLIINKPVSVISSTKDAVIKLHSVSGKYPNISPGNCFAIVNGASGSNISGLYLDNTECWVYNLYDATLHNMTMHVKNASVGNNVGQTSLRFSNNITLDKCYIYTEDNGGSSSFVWTGCNNCTIQNSVVEAQGNVGNLVYIGNPYNYDDKPADYNMTAFGNKVINCTILGGTGGISNPIQNMATNTTIKGCTINAGGSASTGTNGTFKDNVINGAVRFTLSTNTTVTNNTFNSGLATIEKGSKVHNNRFQAVTIRGAETEFEENTANDLLTINNPVNVVNNNLTKITISSNGKTSNITDNNITGNITSAAANVTISKNDIRTNTEYAVEVTGAQNVITNNTIYSSSKTGNSAVKASATSTVADNQPEMPGDLIITDETYPEFFDENGYAIVEKIPDYSTVVLTGTFNNKAFKFKNISATITNNNTILKDCVIISEDTGSIIIDGIVFENTKVTENAVVFDSDNNILRNSKITKTTNNESKAREIVVSGNNNLVQNVTVDITGGSHPVDYSEFPSVSPITGILVTGSSNIIQENSVTFHETSENNDGSTDLITINGALGEAKNNKILRNELNALNANGYLYAINVGVNGNYNDVSYNNINVNSSFYAYGIQHLECPVYGNNFTYNNIRVNATNTAYGIFANIWSWDSDAKFGDIQAKYNKIYVNAENAYAIQLGGNAYGNNVLENLNITYNNLYVNGTYAMGVGLYKTNNVYMYRNTYTIAGKTSEPNPLSQDYVQARTAGICILNSNNTRIQTEQGNNVTNGPNVIIKDSTIGTIGSGLAYKSDMANIILENSERFNITSLIINSTDEYGIGLVNSSSNRIQSNTLNTYSANDGNGRILVDENSKDNTISNNKPTAAVLKFDTTTAKLNDILNITVNVTVDGKKVANGTVIFTDDNDEMIGIAEIINGTATVEYGLIDSLDNITVQAKYQGYQIIPASSIVKQVITVYAESEVQPIEEDLTLGEDTTLTALFYDDNYLPINNGKAIFRVNGKTLRNDNGEVIYVDVINGVAELPNVNITDEWMKPDTTVQAIYCGDENNDPIITKEMKVNVTKPTASVQLTAPETGKAGDKITLSASITVGNEIVTSGRVAFKMNGKTLKGEDGKALYVDVVNGFANVEYTIPAKTKASLYKLTAVFTDSSYERSEAEANITITK
jgi:hypothetical protein